MSIRLLLPVLLAFSLPLAADAKRGPRPAAPATSAASAPTTAARFEWPGPTRAALELPPQAWADVLAAGRLPARPLGYSAEEMKNYGRDRLVMRPVENLFRDARSTLRTSGRVTDELLAVAEPGKLNLSELVRISYGLTDVSAGRMAPAPSAESWGVAWLPAETTPEAALFAAIERCAPTSTTGAQSPLAGKKGAALRAQLAALPSSVQRALARCLIGADFAAAWLDLAYARTSMPANADRATLHALAVAPWSDDENDQAATRSAASFALIESVDRDYLAYGSVLYLLHAGLAADELLAWSGTEDARSASAGLTALSLSFPTRFGLVSVSGTGGGTHDQGAFLTLDLGGDDRWVGAHGVPDAPASRLALALDVAGNDSWDGGDQPVALGCGLLGFGGVMDLAGDDTWRVVASGLGAAWFGTGLLADYSGRDTYVVKDSWAQGAAHVGVGLLVDLAGDDSYECAQQSQGLGSTLGAGVLLDLAGNDRYIARDDGNIEEIYLNQSVAMAQGCGFGRRADLGDGHSLAGGFGILLDGAGDDFYHAQVWAQGAGYWWACGILEDRAGNDTYENGKYSLGAGAHFAVGVFVDLMGNDKYNVGVETAVNQYHGHARDGSMGVAVDGDGDDHYFFRSHCAGSADLGSIALFWDRRGNDRHDVAIKDAGPPNGWTETPPMGSATWYVPYRSFRDDLPTTGIFLDTGGDDTHSAGSPAHLRKTWTRAHAPASFGIGMDAAWYPKKVSDSFSER